MSIDTHSRTTPERPALDALDNEFAPGEWDLDITFVESGASVDKLIYMTNDGCGKTCESACSTTCPA
jgi:FxLD family lantipeptide